MVLFDGCGGEYLVYIQWIECDCVLVELGVWCDVEWELLLVIMLVQVLQVGEKMDYMIQKVVELGVCYIVLVESWCSVMCLVGEWVGKWVVYW